MKAESIKDKLNKVAISDSKWLEKAEWSEANESWLNKSADIAFKVLRALREKGMAQKDLADKLNVSPQQVSKIVKGKENLTLETITKLEHVLGVELVVIPTYHSTKELLMDLFQTHYTNTSLKTPLTTTVEKYETKQFVVYQPSVNDPNDQIAA